MVTPESQKGGTKKKERAGLKEDDGAFLHFLASF